MLSRTLRARDRLGVCLNDRSARDRERAIGGAAQLELEQALARRTQLVGGTGSLALSGSRSRLLGHALRQDDSSSRRARGAAVAALPVVIAARPLWPAEQSLYDVFEAGRWNARFSAGIFAFSGLTPRRKAT
jgi:hypothetical protein